MMELLVCTPDDVKLLAKMNRMLIEDEKAENSMTLDELEQRMIGFLNSSYKAFLFKTDGTVVGYALVNTALTPLYLRHFFICREARRKGYGKSAFHMLLDFLHTDTIDIEAYVWNHTGVAFWKSLGFSERCYNMRFRK